VDSSLAQESNRDAMTPRVISGARIVTPHGVLDDHAVLIGQGWIVALCPPGEVPAGAAIERLDGGWLVPGFIDVQVNGGGGVLFNDRTDVDGITAIAAAHRRFGTTALLPTLISDTLDKVAQAIDAVDAAIGQGVPGVVGVHIEGPFLNPAKHGIHDPAYLRVLGEDEIALLTRPGRGRRLVTIAPELAPPGAIARLRAAGVIVCAGHSMASYEQTMAALDEGLDGFTHLFNAMSGLSAREPGMVGAALNDRRSRFGLIADGHHVHPASMRLALAARGMSGAMLVTDAMPPVGSHIDHFMLGDREIRMVDGICRGADGTLAGSSLDMASAFRNAVEMIGVDPQDAALMASATPADFLGLAGERGAIAPGLAADLVHLTPAFDVARVWIGGTPA
jgi:N-acetylglucosamine-6-phosphate deacetylase